MSRRIRILVGNTSFEAELNDSKTAQAVWDALPIQGAGSLWGKEIYFTIPVELGPENPSEVVDPGTLAYWPMGNAFCIFWGATPASQGDECRPYSAVNVFGHITGDLSPLDGISDLKVVVEKIT